MSTSGSGTAPSQSESQSEADEPLPPDAVYHLLQNQRRRLALRYLREVSATAELREIAEQVAAWENDVPQIEITSAQRQRAYIALYQSHLPKLAEKGIIEYDKHRKTVARTEKAARLDRYLALDAADRDADADAGGADLRDDPPATASEAADSSDTDAASRGSADRTAGAGGLPAVPLAATGIGAGLLGVVATNAGFGAGAVALALVVGLVALLGADRLRR